MACCIFLAFMSEAPILGRSREDIREHARMGKGGRVGGAVQGSDTRLKRANRSATVGPWNIHTLLSSPGKLRQGILVFLP